jgi:hypothetical protein
MMRLLLDALAPLLGVLPTFAFHFPVEFQVIYLGIFAWVLFISPVQLSYRRRTALTLPG